MSRRIPSIQHAAAPLMLPAPSAVDETEPRRHLAHIRHRQPQGTIAGGAGLQGVARPGSGQTDIVREQRDGLARLRDKLAAAVRALEAENEALRGQLARYQRYPPVEEQDAEAAGARQLARERGIDFHRMPEGVYPGRPYVTQQELIRHGVTRYSRQNMSRLARDERSVPAIVIADRVLLPPEGVRALLEREQAAARDASPRRRPGGNRASDPPAR